MDKKNYCQANLECRMQNLEFAFFLCKVSYLLKECMSET